MRGATELLGFLKSAFDAQMHEVMEAPEGGVRHADVLIGDSHVMLGEAPPDHEPMAAMLYLYVSDMQRLYDQALAAGGEVVQEPTDHFYGDRSGAVKDPAGNVWYSATHVEDVSPEEMAKRAEAGASSGGGN